MATQLPSLKRGQNPSPPKNFGPCLLWPNGWMGQDATWYGGRPRPRPHCARCGPSSPLPKKGDTAPQFLAHVCCGQMPGWIKRPLGMELGFCSSDILLDGDPASPCKGYSPQFSVHVYCGQTAGGIKMPLGTKVGLRPANIVLHRDPAPP